MIIKRQHPETGKINSLDLNITKEQWGEYYVRGKAIQATLIDLTPQERDYILTGYLPDEMLKIYAEQEANENISEVTLMYYVLYFNKHQEIINFKNAAEKRTHTIIEISNDINNPEVFDEHASVLEQLVKELNDIRQVIFEEKNG